MWIIPARAGLPEGRRLPGPVAGIIPARAGFTRTSLVVVVDLADHPRSRGVYRVYAPDDLGVTWIIPARAGFTRLARFVSLLAADHPRSRGVYSEEP